MAYRMLIAGVAAMLLAPAAWGQAITQAEALKFFERYVALGEAYDVAVADLYLDEGRIRSLRRSAAGQDRMLQMTGTQWKGLLAKVMPLAKAKGDRSEYRNLRAEAAGSLLRVRAERYSVLKCYWDRSYYMLIARQADGALRIVEEYTETQAQSSC